jgi:hypothetical protein
MWSARTADRSCASLQHVLRSGARHVWLLCGSLASRNAKLHPALASGRGLAISPSHPLASPPRSSRSAVAPAGWRGAPPHTGTGQAAPHACSLVIWAVCMNTPCTPERLLEPRHGARSGPDSVSGKIKHVKHCTAAYRRNMIPGLAPPTIARNLGVASRRFFCDCPAAFPRRPPTRDPGPYRSRRRTPSLPSR